MEKHYRILSIIYIVFGILNIIFLVSVFLVLEKILVFANVEAEVIELIRFIGIPLGMTFLIISILSIVGGIGLSKHYKWAKVLVIVIGCLYLLSFPIGTIIGVYTIVVYVSEIQNNAPGANRPEKST